LNMNVILISPKKFTELITSTKNLEINIIRLKKN